MDVNQVLKNTLSPDAATRTDAEQQLSNAAETNFSAYLQTLAQELANENADQDVRMAAGLALKNPFSARDYVRLKEVQNRWLQQVSAEVKTGVKQLAVSTLASNAPRVGAQAAQFVATIAAIEIPRQQWEQLLPALVASIRDGHDNQKQACLATIGYVCENDDPELRNSLSAHSNTILTAVVQGARKEEQNNDVRNTAMTALGDSLEFVRTNFENEGERNYIMQVVCEATQAQDSRIQQAAYGCLNRIMALYYDKMYFYMEKALFGLTIQGMKNEDEDVAKLAVEFWCTVCEEEISIEDDNTQAASDETQRPYFNFARIATQEVVPVLLDLLTKQDEDAADEEYNIHRAAYQCLQLWAQAVGNNVIPSVLPFIEQHLRSEDWHYRDAAVSAFGAVMEGPDEKMLDNLVKQALPLLINMMDDANVHVKDSTAFTLGRISENVSSSIEPSVHLQPLISSLFAGLASNPKMASSCCWALMNLADRFTGDFGSAENPLTPHFDASVEHLMNTTARNDIDNTVRTACYEVLTSFVANAASNSIPTVARLSDAVLQRLEATIPMRQQVVSVEDKLTLDEVQTSLSTVVMSIVQRVEVEIKPQADRIMTVLLQVLNTLNNKSSVAESVFAAVGALANALEADFQKYMDSFTPILFKALSNREDASICAMAIGLVSDIARSMNELVQPYCDQFMNHLLDNLRSPQLSNQFKPAILQCFGDIAQAIGGAFESYLVVVAQVLDQAAGVQVEAGISYEMLDYLVSLREGIMDAWAGAIIAMKSSMKNDVLKPYVETIFRMLHLVFTDQNRSEALLRSAMGVLGDLADAFPNGEYADYYRNEWVSAMIKEVRSNREFTQTTNDTARWAREQVKRQLISGNQEGSAPVNMS